MDAEELIARDILKAARDSIIKELGPEYERYKFLDLIEVVLDRAVAWKRFGEKR